MKTLIINGSPRKNGHTAALISLLKEQLQGEIIEISAFYDKISPCVDCRSCWTKKGCAIRDGMDKIYADDFDAVVLATPVHMSNLPGPLISLASRFQAFYAARRFLNDPLTCAKKRASC
jgi:multimeric flavodoxin WrbA